MNSNSANMDYLVGKKVVIYKTVRVTKEVATPAKPEGSVIHVTYQGVCMGWSIEGRGDDKYRPTYWLIVAIEAGKLMTVRMEDCNVDLWGTSREADSTQDIDFDTPRASF